MHNINNKIETFKKYYNQGIYNQETLEYLKSKNLLTEEEVRAILFQPKAVADDRIVELEYDYEIWDKVTPVNGRDPQQFIEKMGLETAEEIGLFKLNDYVVEASDLKILQINSNMRANTTAEDIAEIHAKNLTKARNTPIINTEDTARAISILSDLQRVDEIKEIKALLVEILTAIKEK